MVKHASLRPKRLIKVPKMLEFYLKTFALHVPPLYMQNTGSRSFLGFNNLFVNRFSKSLWHFEDFGMQKDDKILFNRRRFRSW